MLKACKRGKDIRYVDRVSLFENVCLSQHAILFLLLLDVRYKFQEDQSYDLSKTSEKLY